MNVSDFKGRYSFNWRDAYPRARGRVVPYLPGYSKDGDIALFKAAYGPWHHYSWLDALLEQRNGIWEVKWFQMIHSM